MEEASHAKDTETLEELQTAQKEAKGKVELLEKQRKSLYGTFATMAGILGSLLAGAAVGGVAKLAGQHTPAWRGGRSSPSP